MFVSRGVCYSLQQKITQGLKIHAGIDHPLAFTLGAVVSVLIPIFKEHPGNVTAQ